MVTKTKNIDIQVKKPQKIELSHFSHFKVIENFLDNVLCEVFLRYSLHKFM